MGLAKCPREMPIAKVSTALWWHLIVTRPSLSCGTLFDQAELPGAPHKSTNLSTPDRVVPILVKLNDPIFVVLTQIQSRFIAMSQQAADAKTTVFSHQDQAVSHLKQFLDLSSSQLIVNIANYAFDESRLPLGQCLTLGCKQ
ncbi:MAG: hypothetical protein E5V93_09485 [Mesorhizobium sp.]|nr:MAG: hypothetical protein E5V93_09485 [Mesorhizobium sp.]